jgi:hypothetical protein
MLSMVHVFRMSRVEAGQGQTAPASDAGGVAVRQGFRYQDHVAAQLVLLMIGDQR